MYRVDQCPVLRPWLINKVFTLKAIATPTVTFSVTVCVTLAQNHVVITFTFTLTLTLTLTPPFFTTQNNMTHPLLTKENAHDPPLFFPRPPSFINNDRSLIKLTQDGRISRYSPDIPLYVMSMGRFFFIRT